MKSFMDKNTLKNSELQLIYNNLSDDKCESLLGTNQADIQDQISRPVSKNDKQPQEVSMKETVTDY